MNTLVIHPHDITTTFLESVYEHVADRTVIRGGVTREELAALVSSHDRIMMMGHGSPWGLLAVGQFPGSGTYIVEYSIAQLLKKKKNSVFIWCNADQYVKWHDLEGFFSGMFISEVREAMMIGLGRMEKSVIDDSNNAFGIITGSFIASPSPRMICENVKRNYGSLATVNPVAAFNNERLYYRPE